jgi:hypothetical protein
MTPSWQRRSVHAFTRDAEAARWTLAAHGELHVFREESGSAQAFNGRVRRCPLVECADDQTRARWTVHAACHCLVPLLPRGFDQSVHRMAA